MAGVRIPVTKALEREASCKANALDDLNGKDNERTSFQRSLWVVPKDQSVLVKVRFVRRQIGSALSKVCLENLLSTWPCLGVQCVVELPEIQALAAPKPQRSDGIRTGSASAIGVGEPMSLVSTGRRVREYTTHLAIFQVVSERKKRFFGDSEDG